MAKRFGTPGSRLINPDMCESRPLAACSIGAQLLFDRLIVQADDQGRLNGDVQIVRTRCLPFVKDATTRRVRQWLEELHQQKLIERYTADGNDLIQIVSWWPEQAGMRRAYPSRWPRPDGWTDKVYSVPRDDRPGNRAHDAISGESAGRVPHVAAKCGDITASADADADAGAGAGAELPAAPTTESAASMPPQTTAHGAFIEFWCQEFERVTETRYAFQKGKDGAHVKAILELAHGDLEVAKARARALLTSNDPYHRNTGIDLGVLRSQWNRLGSARRMGQPTRTDGAAYQPFVPPTGGT